MSEIDLEDVMTAEPEHGIVSLTIRDLTGREYAASIPYPDDGDIDDGFRRLRGALAVLTYRAEAVDIEPDEDEGTGDDA